MDLQAKLDVDVVALQEHDQVTCLVTFDAPVTEVTAERPGEHLIVVVDRSGSMKTEDCSLPMTFGNFAPRSLSRWDWCLNQTVDLARQTAQEGEAAELVEPMVQIILRRQL